jgi:hypothetical protein
MEIQALYHMDKGLRKVKKEYDDYMADVWERTEGDFKAFKDESDINHKAELKNVYMSKIEALTVKSKAYQKIIKKLTAELARVNQLGLDLVNERMAKIYAISYNQVAEECRRVGIKIGKR